MGRFGGKKLPPHWIYIPSRRQIRELFDGLDADVQMVTFLGTGTIHGPDRILLGRLLRKVEEGAWIFHLRMYGVPERSVDGCRDLLADAALQAIQHAIENSLAESPTEATKPTQVLLWFGLTPRGVISKCRVEPVDLVYGW